MTDGAESTQLKSWNAKDTVPGRLLVVNNSDVVADVLWVTPTGAETSYRVLQPGQLHRQGRLQNYEAASLNDAVHQLTSGPSADLCSCVLII